MSIFVMLERKNALLYAESLILSSLKEMRKRQQQSYICLTFFEQDIRELIQLFQNNLQDVEIVIDGFHMSDITQLEQFDPAYQAKSLLARGYSRELEEDDPNHQEERSLIELKINTMSATLLGWKEDGKTEPEILMLIRKVLLRCQNQVHALMITIGNRLLLGSSLSLWPQLQEHHMNFFLQIFIVVGSGILLAPVVAFLAHFILFRLKMETLIFLLPHVTRTAHVYGRREVVSRLIVVLVVLVAFSISLVVASRLLWR